MKIIPNNIKRSWLSNNLAMHDFRLRPSDIKNFFHYTVTLFQSYGLTPTRMGLTGEPYKAKKIISYENGIGQLRQHDYKSLDYFSLYATPPNHGTDALDGIFNVELDLKRKGSFSISLDAQLVKWEENIFIELIKHYESYLSPRYGYGFQRPFKKGPHFFATGVAINMDWNDPDRNPMDKWDGSYFMDDGAYKTGDLRDIFPLNILSQAHKERTVDGIPLFDWIHQDPDRGHITPVQDVWAWFIDLDKVDKVRDIFIHKRLLLCVSPEDLLAQPYT